MRALLFFPNCTYATKAHLKTKQTPFCSTLLLLWYHLLMLNMMQCCTVKTIPLCRSFGVWQPWMHLPPVCWETNATQQNNSSRQEREQTEGFQLWQQPQLLVESSVRICFGQGPTPVTSHRQSWISCRANAEGTCSRVGPPTRNTADICLNSQAELNPKANFCERERGTAFGLGGKHQMKWVGKVHFRLSCPFIETEAFLQKPHCYLDSTPSHTEPVQDLGELAAWHFLRSKHSDPPCPFFFFSERKETELENVTH